MFQGYSGGISLMSSKQGAKPAARKYPRGFVEATPEQILSWFPPSPSIPIDKKVEKCQKCGKPFKRISVEGKIFRICNCVETLKVKETK